MTNPNNCSDFGWNLDDTGWPLRCQRDNLQSVDSDDVERVLGIMQEVATEDDPAFGSNRLLLKASVNTSDSMRNSSVISLSDHTSRLWTHENHACRLQGGSVLDLRLADAAKASLPEEPLHDVLRSWERWRNSVEYENPHEVNKFSQTKGLAFPMLESSDDVFPLRLFVLFPSFNDPASPVRGGLILSSMARHSCYISVRHSRGNTSCWGKVFIDGYLVDVTKNLEVFLTHIRHPTRYRVLYIRELCINRHKESESKQFLTGRFHATVENCSCGIVEMNHVMYLLDEAGYIPEPQRTTDKVWDEPPSVDSNKPIHMPMILRSPKPTPKDAIEEGLDAAAVSNLPSYEYVPLDIVASEIRILAVYPAKAATDPIVVDLYYVPLHSNFQYYALSYFWGSSQTTRYIRDFRTKIAITENLHSALVRFRSAIPEDGLPWFIWADAVCIDQQNSAEKARCIPRMHMIYDEAAVVFVYLLSVEGASKAGLLLEKIAETGYEALQAVQTLQELASLDDWADLYGLFRLPYFSRRWVVQELASASAPTIMIGKWDYNRALRSYSLAATLMVSKLSELLDAWAEQKHPILQQYQELQKMATKENTQDILLARDQVQRVFQSIKTLDFIRSLYKVNQPPSFLFLIISTQNAECADPRDRVYSLWNISRERSTTSIHIGYQGSIEHCYENFTKVYASIEGSLNIICTSQFPTRANNRKVQPDNANDQALQLPSWCPDYRQKDNVSSLIRQVFLHYAIHIQGSMPELDVFPYHADKLNPADTQPRLFRFEGRQLVAHGIVLDTVAFASDDPYEDTPVHDFFDTVAQSWIYEVHTRILRLPSIEAEDGTCLQPQESLSRMTGTEIFHYMNTLRSEEERDALFDAFMSMVIGEAPGSFPGHWNVIGDESSPQWDCRGRDVSPLHVYLSFHERAAHVIRGRRLIITERGHMGLAPWHVREGFKLAILCGCSVPVILEHREEAAVQATADRANVATENSSVRHPPGWYFRGDCFVQGWMKGAVLNRYGSTTQEAWDKVKELGNELWIN